MTTGTTDQLEARFGAQIRSVRRAQGLSQVELARRANVSRSAVINLESGAGSSLSTLAKVLDGLDRGDWLLTLEAPPDAFNPLDLLDQQSRPTGRPTWRPLPRTPRRPT